MVPLPPGPPPPLPGFAPMGAGFDHLSQSARNRMVMTKQALMARIAMGSLPTADRWSTNPADNLTPETITRCRREAEAGYPWRWADLCEQLLMRNGYLKSFAAFRRAWVHQVPWNVQPPPHLQDDPLAKKIAAWQTAVLNGLRPCWADAMNNLLSAPAFGYAAAEQFWNYRSYSIRVDGQDITVDDTLVPVWLEHVHQKRFIFQQDYDTPMLWDGYTIGGGIRWPEGKFIWHRALGDGITERRGYMTAAAWIEYALQAAWRDLIIYMHLYGIPQFALMVEKEILDQAEERAILDQGLQDYGQGMIPYFLSEAKVEQLGVVNGTDALHPQVIQLGRSMLSVIVTGSELAQTQGDGTGSYNAGQTHATTSHIYCVPDGTSLAGAVEACTLLPSVNRNIDQLCRAFKAPPDAIRQRSAQFGWRAVSPAPTAAELLSVYEGLVRMRFPASTTEIAQRLGVAIGQGNDIVRGEPTVIPEGAKAVSGKDAADGAEGNPRPIKENADAGR